MQIERPTSEGETITFNTRVAGVKKGYNIVTEELYNTLKGRVGELSIMDCKTGGVARIVNYMSLASVMGNTSFYERLGPENGEIILTEQFAQMHGLQEGDSVALTKTLTHHEMTLWECGKDKSNLFGSSWKIHRYVATGIFSGFAKDPTDGRLGIFLNRMQIENLNLDRSLRPLCGYHKFGLLKAESPEAVGLVKVYFNGEESEVDVFPSDNNPYPSFALITTESLFRKLGGIQIGDPLQICSRFDLSSFAAPVLGKRESSDRTYLDMLRCLSFKELKKQIFEGKHWREFDFSTRQVLADLLEELTLNAGELANDPDLLLKVINYMYHIDGSIAQMLEYSELLKAIAQHEAFLKQHEQALMDLLALEFLKQDEKDSNPPLLDALFTMGVNLKNMLGENCLHIMFRLKRGDVGGSSSEGAYTSCPHFMSWMTEKTPEGRTPLHYICHNGSWIEIVLIGKKIFRGFNLKDFNDPHAGTPFHALAQDLSEKTQKKIMTFNLLVEKFGIECLNWLDYRDHLGETPLNIIQKNELLYAGILEYLQRELDSDSEKTGVIRQILNRLNPQEY